MDTMNCRNNVRVFFCVLLVVSTFPALADAQGGAASGMGISPSPLVRLTGVLEASEKPHRSVLPVLRVWIDGTPWLFRVVQVEPVMSAYRAEEKMRKVSLLGLRFLAEKDVLATLQRTDMRDRPIVIEGWLRPKAGVLHVRSVWVVEEEEGPARH